MYNKILTGILSVLIIAIMLAVGYLGYNYYKKVTLNADAEEFLEEFDTVIVPVGDQQPEEPEETEEPEKPEEQTTQPSNKNNNSNVNKKTTNDLYYKGYRVVGKLEMPTIKIQYPILYMVTDVDANAIEVSVGMIYGPGVNKAGNTVIGGHNYNNGLFFGKNKNLKIGDKIYLTDMDGNRVEYTIYNKYTTPEADTSWITRTTDGKTEVTLYTCDATGKNRLIVCARAD